MCVEGSASISYNGNNTISISKGETMLLPCNMSEITIIPFPSVKLLEIYM